jgi:hypothetical protein
MRTAYLITLTLLLAGSRVWADPDAPRTEPQGRATDAVPDASWAAVGDLPLQVARSELANASARRSYSSSVL